MEYQTKLFQKNTVNQIEIIVDSQAWDAMLANATAEEYIMCDVTVNGTSFASVGIRPKGNSSLSTVESNPESDRYSFKLEFDHYVKGQTCWGLDKFVLNNMQSDNTYMKEYLSYDILSFIGVTSPLYSYAHITVNGEEWGLYLAAEGIEESFAERNYETSYGQFYKPENMRVRGDGRMNDRIGQMGENGDADQFQPQDNRGGEAPEGGKAVRPPDAGGNAFNGGRFGFEGEMTGSSGGVDLVYTDNNSDSCSNIFDNAVFSSAKESDFQRVIQALKGLSTGEDLECCVDVDQVLRYLAANAVLVNLDSYFGSMQHNYYLYEKDGILSMVPWDYNLAFGGFQAGSAESAVNFAIDTPVSGTTLEARPIIGKLLANQEYLERYHQYLQQIVTEYFDSGKFESTVDSLDSMIGSYVQNDATAFCTVNEYKASLPVLKQFGALRAKSIQGQLDGTIPSTSAGQSKDASALIQADFDLSALGVQGGSNADSMPGALSDDPFSKGEAENDDAAQGSGEGTPPQPPGNQGGTAPGNGEGTLPQPPEEMQNGMQALPIDLSGVWVMLVCAAATAAGLVFAIFFRRRKQKNIL